MAAAEPGEYQVILVSTIRNTPATTGNVRNDADEMRSLRYILLRLSTSSTTA